MFVPSAKRKTSLSLDAEMLDEALALGLNVSAVSNAALSVAVRDARRKAWLKENAAALAAQAEWLERNGHPAADIMVSPGRETWSD
jgi:antitoxin CcdA